MKKRNKSNKPEQIDLSRRKALSRLGMAATAIYAAPVLMTLSKSANAATTPSVSGPSTSSPSASDPSTSAPSVSSPSVSAPSVSAPSVSGPSVSSPSAPNS